MGRNLKAKDYKGELEFDWDEVNNLGANWYDSYFNEQYLSKHHGDLESTEGMYGSNKPAICSSKYRSEGMYEPKYILKSLRPETLLGRGTFSEVWKARFGTFNEVAVKRFDVSKVKSKIVWKERDFLIHLKNKRIVNILGSFFDKDAFLVLELCLSSLAQLIQQVNEKTALRFVVQLAEGLKWIHAKNIIHCDLHPANCLVTSTNNIVLSSFGNAIHLPNDAAIVQAMNSLGLPGYQDSETNQDNTYSKKTDMYALGCIFFEMLTHDFLLHYGIEVPLDEYLNVYKHGRLVNLQAWPTSTTERESLELRIRKYCENFMPAINSLTSKRRNRPTADKFLTSRYIKLQLELARVSPDASDENDTVKFTPVNIVNTKETFCLKEKVCSAEEICAYNRIYYDETEVTNSRITGLNLIQYDTEEVAEIILESNLVTKLVDVLSNLNPIANAELRNFVDERLEEKWNGNNLALRKLRASRPYSQGNIMSRKISKRDHIALRIEKQDMSNTGNPSTPCPKPFFPAKIFKPRTQPPTWRKGCKPIPIYGSVKRFDCSAAPVDNFFAKKETGKPKLGCLQPNEYTDDLVARALALSGLDDISNPPVPENLNEHETSVNGIEIPILIRSKKETRKRDLSEERDPSFLP